MNRKPDYAAVIPCFNEARWIGGVVSAVRAHLPKEIIVVDDGSTDGTAHEAQRAGAKVIRHLHNAGKGAALRSGLEHARQMDVDWALTLDGDGQHAATDIPRFLESAASTLPALVVGNRMHDTMAMPWLRRQVNRWMTRRLSRLTGTTLLDSQCGFRLLNLEAYSTLALSSERFEIESEMLVAFLAAHHRVEFVPVRTIYNAETSKIHPWSDSWRWFRWWWRQRRLMSKAHALPGIAEIIPASTKAH